MQRKKLVSGNVSFLKNVAIIYILIVSLIFSMFTTISIPEIVSADSNIYYVSTVGSNSYNGLYPTFQGGSNGPWKTIEYAVTKVTNGDTVNILAGTYTPSTQIIIDNKRASDNWLTIRNYEDDVVIVDGTNCPTDEIWHGVFNVYRSKYIRITGITVNHSAMCGISVWGLVVGVSNSFIKVDNCTISNSSASAFVVLSPSQNITFEYNYVYKNFVNWSGNGVIPSGQETISFQNITSFSINNNTLINNYAENIDVKAGCDQGVICYNTINNTGGYLYKTGMTYYGGPSIMLDARGISHNISIYNNKIFGNNTGISLNTESTGHYEYIYIYNNEINSVKIGDTTVVTYPQPLLLANTGYSGDIFHHIYIYSNTIHTGSTNSYPTFEIGHYTLNQLNSGNLQYLYVYNNIFVTSYTGTSYSIAAHRLLPTDIYLKNNSFYRASGTLRNRWNLNTYTNQTAWNFGNDAIFTDPKFVILADYNGDFHLESNSPCIDTADDTLTPSFDYDSILRPQGTASDRGAYEYLSFYDSTLPQISDISIATSSPLDTNVNFGWENISCIVTDNIAVDTVYITIVRPNDAEINIEMTKIADSNCYYYNSTWSDYGNYSYSIRAIDTSENTEYSDSFYLSLPPNWDINNDGICSVLDLILLSNLYNEVGSNGWIREDLDNNGVVDILDMSLVSNYYGEIWYT